MKSPKKELTIDAVQLSYTSSVESQYWEPDVSRAISVLVLLVLCGCGGSDGPRKYPVTGKVLINGQPAAFVRVQFLHADATTPGNYKMPVGMTDTSGAFSLSTNGDKDGAVVGEYSVTFEWMSGNDLGAFDKLGGKFAQTSQHKAKVEAKPNELPPFELTIPEKAIVTKPSRGQ